MSIVISAGDQLSHQARPSNNFNDAEIFGERFLMGRRTSMCTGQTDHDLVKATESEWEEDEWDDCTNDEESPRFALSCFVSLQPGGVIGEAVCACILKSAR